MSNLHTTTEIVKGILQECPNARNSDNVLYLQVLKVLGEEKGINLENMSVLSFFMQMKELGIPPLKTVTRSRRKIVKAYPHLAGNDTVEGFRKAKEEEYKEYARQVTV